MITHYIYHIEGRKVGCTKNLESRKKLYLEDEGDIPALIILEELEDATDIEAGDREWYWADKFGYRRGVHYTVTMISRYATPEKRSEWGRKGATKKFKNMTAEQQLEWVRAGGRRLADMATSESQRERGLRTAQKKTFEEHSEWGRKGGKKSSSYRVTCPHCGLESMLAIMYRWHFDNCLQKPRTILGRPK